MLMFRRSPLLLALVLIIMSFSGRAFAFRGASLWPSAFALRRQSCTMPTKASFLPASSTSLTSLKMVATDIELRLQEKNIVLPDAAPPAANYVPYVVTGNYIYVAGQIPMINGVLQYKGKVPTDYSIEEGYKCARLCGLNIISQVKAACGGDLSKVKRVVKLVGFVNCPPDFYDIPKVINGASDLMVEVFGEAGRHARSAVGSVALPLNVATEVEAVIELEETFSEYGPGSSGFDKRGKATAFMVGMKVEVLDRKFKDVVTVGTIKEVQVGKVRIGFDGWDDTYDFECSLDDGDFQPPGTCLRAGARLSPPNGYKGFFDWGSYLQETDSIPAPPQVFKSATVFPSYKGDVSIKFEMWHRNEAAVVPLPPTPQQQERENRQTNKKP